MEKWVIFLIAFISSLVITFLLYPLFINYLKSINVSQAVSEYSLAEYKNKVKTPIMGGILFIVIPLVIFLACDPSFLSAPLPNLLFILIAYICYFFVGFIDDLIIIITKKNDGISPSVKLLLEFSSIIILYLIFRDSISTTIYIPYYKLTIDLKLLYLPFLALVYVSEANACNFTDGMDGLCAGVSIIGLICFAILAFVKGEVHVFLFIVCVIGSLCAYMFYNFHPAKIFMGDSGSLALGALFAGLAFILDAYVPLLFIGFVFIVEMICVCLQRISYKLFRKRIFPYTPIHYAFIIKGKSEVKVVIGFYILAFITGAMGVLVGLM